MCIKIDKKLTKTFVCILMENFFVKPSIILCSESRKVEQNGARFVDIEEHYLQYNDQFGKFLNNLLRDRLVSGLNPGKIKGR